MDEFHGSTFFSLAGIETWLGGGRAREITCLEVLHGTGRLMGAKYL